MKLSIRKFGNKWFVIKHQGFVECVSFEGALIHCWLEQKAADGPR